MCQTMNHIPKIAACDDCAHKLTLTAVRETKSEVERLAREYTGRKVAMLFTAPRHWLHKPQPYKTEGHVYDMQLRKTWA